MEESGVEKEQHIVILTDTLRIEGILGIFSGIRLTDYMNESKPFIPITDATVKDLYGRPVMKSTFINVKREAIQLVAPAGDIESA
jgi:Family of unknown function (DUF6812)